MSRPTTTLSAIGVGLLGIGAATFALRQHIWTRMLGLRPAEFDVTTHHNVRVEMPDGITLATDVYRPKTDNPLPTIVIRTPYGRNGTLGFLEIFFANRFAERGYNVVLQDVRGRLASEGDFIPYRHESADGVATVDWILEQSWSDGQIATWGQSYLGYTQWAIAANYPKSLKAMVPIITQSHLGRVPEHGVLLDLPLRWMYILDAFDSAEQPLRQRIRRLVNIEEQEATLSAGFDMLPLVAADEAILGEQVPFYREWVEHIDPSNPYWKPVDFRTAAAECDVPTHLIAGWHDVFLEGQLEDYAIKKAAGQDPFLTIGPWVHTDQASRIDTLSNSLDLFDTILKGKEGLLPEKRVRIHVMGADEWREYTSWPPETNDKHLYLRADSTLSADAPTESDSEPADHYTYDPADPTPSVGGPMLAQSAGAQDNSELEARSDVLTYTLPVLEEDIEMIGAPTVRLHVQSSVQWTDFFVRITSVHPDGQSLNITDGIYSLTPERGKRSADGSIAIDVKLSPTAYRFQAGQQIRLQLSSGAFPRFARNLGTGQHAFTSTDMVAAEQTIYHDAVRPSVVTLPIPLETQ